MKPVPAQATTAAAAAATKTAEEKEKPKKTTVPRSWNAIQKFQKKVSQVILIKKLFGGKNYDQLAAGERRADTAIYMRKGCALGTLEEDAASV
jgi:hypothetical protein